MLFCACGPYSEAPPGHAAEPEHRRLVAGGAVALAHDGGPTPPARAVLGDLLEEVAVRVEEERDLRRELVDGHPAAFDHGVAVGDAVGQRERHLLHGVGAGVAEVRARHRDRVEPGHLGGTELDGVGDQPQRRLRRPDPGAARGVLLEDVVLDGAGELLARHALLLGGGDVERQQDRGGAVDREAGADLVQRDAVEQDLGIGERVDRDADPADLLAELRIIGVEAALRRQVERDRQPRAALVEQVAVAAVGLLGGAEARVLAKRPQLAAVSAREVAAGERIGRPAQAGHRPDRPVRRRAPAGCRRGSELGRSSMDNVLAKNENANTADRKRARNRVCGDAWKLGEDPVHSDYGTCVK